MTGTATFAWTSAATHRSSRSSNRRSTGGSFDGIDLFESGADEVIMELAARLRLDPAVYRPGRHSYYFPDLRMSLWRSCVSEVDGEQGFEFDSVSVHAPGYYDAKAMAFIRRQSGLPPE